MSESVTMGEQYTFYSLINLDNGKRYIGRTQHIDSRIKAHFSAIKSKRHPNRYLMKDSDDHFDYEILETGLYTLSDSKTREQSYMVQYKTYDANYGYNVSDQGMKRLKAKIENTPKTQIPDHGMDFFLWMHLFLNADKETQEMIEMMLKTK